MYFTSHAELDAPTLDFVGITNSSVLVTWNPSRAKITNYFLSWSPTINNKPKTLRLHPRITRHQLNGLLPGTEYSVALVAKQGNIESPRVHGVVTTCKSLPLCVSKPQHFSSSFPTLAPNTSTNYATDKALAFFLWLNASLIYPH